MILFAAIILGTLATYRIVHMIIEDEILSRPREYLFDKNNHTLTYFLTCPWCLSMWVAPIFSFLYLQFPTIFFFASLSLSFSALTGILFKKV